MNSKRSMLSAMAFMFVLGLLILGNSTVSAAATLTAGNATSGTCSHVFPSIQDALNVAAPGDTIQVCPGTYLESLGVNTGVVLAGPNAGISPNGGTRVAEAILNGGGSTTIRISTTASVTIDGFTFSGGSGAMIDSYTSGHNPSIFHNIFTSQVNGLFFFEPALFKFEDNYLHDLVDCGGCEGLFIAGNWNGTTGTIASIKANVWSNLLDSPATNLSNISGTLSGNKFSYVSYYCFLLANGTNVDICGNTFDHTINPGGSRTWGAGVRFYTPSTGFGARMTGNTFANNYVGIGVRMGSPTADITGMDIYAHDNNFTGNVAAGLRHDGLGTFNATKNWWNSASGPTNGGNPGGTGDAIDGSGPVIFSPWLNAAASVGCFPVASNKDQCKANGWQTLFRANGTGFKNQGDCVSYTQNGK